MPSPVGDPMKNDFWVKVNSIFILNTSSIIKLMLHNFAFYLDNKFHNQDFLFVFCEILIAFLFNLG